MKRQDMNCFTGNWPFFRLRCNTVEKLKMLHAEANISSGLISSLEAVFYQDPYEAELQLAQKIKGTAYKQAMILNPTLPAWKDDLKRAVGELNISAVRLMPGYHGYALTDPVMDSVADALRELQLPLVITLRVRDERTAWMIQPELIPMTDIASFVSKNPDILVLLTGIRVNELRCLDPSQVPWNNLYADPCFFKDSFHSLEDAWELEHLRGHILFGSAAPMMELQGTVMQIETANIPDEDKAAMFAAMDTFLK